MSTIEVNTYQVDDGAVGDRIAHRIRTAGNGNVLNFDSNTSVGNTMGIGHVAPTAGVIFKAAGAVIQDDCASSKDASAVGTDTTVAIPLGGAITILQLGHRNSSTGQLNGRVRRFKYFDVRKSNAFLEDITLS